MTIVVPMYNEAQRLDAPAFARFAAAHPDVGFVFVDDGSVDATAELAAGLCATIPDRLRLLRLPVNRGKAEAVRQGVLAALASEPRPELVGYWDADLATPLDAIEDLRGVLRADPRLRLAMGSRVMLLGRTIERRAHRHYLGRVFATFASLTLDLPVYDTQCGAKLLRADPALGAVFGTPFRSRWIFDVEILARLGRAGDLAGRIFEFPLWSWRDVGTSKVRPLDFARAALELAAVFARYRLPGRRRAVADSFLNRAVGGPLPEPSEAPPTGP